MLSFFRRTLDPQDSVWGHHKSCQDADLPMCGGPGPYRDRLKTLLLA